MVGEVVPERHPAMALNFYVPDANVLLGVFEFPSCPRNHGSVVKAKLEWARVQLEAVLAGLGAHHLLQSAVAGDPADHVHPAQADPLLVAVLKHKPQSLLHLVESRKLGSSCQVYQVFDALESAGFSLEARLRDVFPVDVFVQESADPGKGQVSSLALQVRDREWNHLRVS